MNDICYCTRAKKATKTFCLLLIETHTMETVINDDKLPFFKHQIVVNKSLYPTYNPGHMDIQDTHILGRGMLYILVCEHQYLYVGFVTSSGNCAARLSLHASGAACKFTREIAKMLYCRQVIYPASKALEREVTIWLASHVPEGWRVRGASWCQAHTEPPRLSASTRSS